jgi:hypothetical protein
MSQHGAHASKLIVAGVEYRIRRDFDLILRIEERFGEIGAFIMRAETERLKVQDLADLYAILLSGEGAPVSPDIIKRHIVDTGTLAAFRPAIMICGSLFIGEERFMDALAKQPSGNGMAPQAGA